MEQIGKQWNVITLPVPNRAAYVAVGCQNLIILGPGSKSNKVKFVSIEFGASPHTRFSELCICTR